jgi:hypothetical protein
MDGMAKEFVYLGGFDQATDDIPWSYLISITD